jgi:hypothetical protein
MGQLVSEAMWSGLFLKMCSLGSADGAIPGTMVDGEKADCSMSEK